MVSLRDLKEQDMEIIRQWRNLPDVRKYMYTDHVISQEEHRQWFESVLKDQTTRYWIIMLDEEDVGLVYLFDINWTHGRCYWGFYLASPNVRGRGVGSLVEYTILNKVFEEIGLRKLCCEVLDSNDAVTRMHKRFGFVQEGTFRSHVVKKDRACDVVCLAMLREEWQSQKPVIETALSERGLL